MQRRLYLLILAGCFCLAGTLGSSAVFADLGKPVQVIYGAGHKAYELAADHGRIATSAVFMASRLNGGQRLITTGSLSQYANDLQSFTYSAEPADRLVVKFLNGQQLSYAVTDFRGNYQGGPEGFLAGDHGLAFQVLDGAATNLQIQSWQYQGGKGGQMHGRLSHAGIAYEASLQLAGHYTSNTDTSGSEYKTQFTWKGEISYAGGKLQIDEVQNFHLISARNARGNYETSSSSERLINSQLIEGENTYGFQNGRVRKVFRNGQPSDPDYWLASGGTFSHNGHVVGEIKALYEYPYAKFKLLLAQDQAIELEKWLLADRSQ